MEDLAARGEALRNAEQQAPDDPAHKEALAAWHLEAEALDLSPQHLAAAKALLDGLPEAPLRATLEARLLGAPAEAAPPPRTPPTWDTLQAALAHLRAGRAEEARALLAVAHERLPQDRRVRRHLARVEAALGNHQAALALYDRLTARTSLPTPMGGRARALRARHRVDEAARQLHTADQRWRALLERYGLAVAPGAVDFWLDDLPRPADARRWAEALLEARRTPESLVRAARARASARDEEGARALLEEAERTSTGSLPPAAADAWRRLGGRERR